MKKIIILFTLCVFNAGGCFSQKTLSKDKFDKLVDYMNVEITKAYIENWIKTNPSKKDPLKLKSCKLDSIAYHDTVKIVLKNNSLETPVPYSILENALYRYRWKTARQNITMPYDSIKEKYLSTMSNDDMIKELFDFKVYSGTSVAKKTMDKHPATNGKCEDWRTKIETHIRSISNSNPDSPTPPRNSELSTDTGLLASGDEMNSVSGTNNIHSVLIVIALLLCGVLLYFYLQKRKSRSSDAEQLQDDNNNSEMTQWFEDTVNKQYSKICELEKTVSEQQSKIRELEKTVSEQQSKIRELEKTVNKMSAEKQNSQPVAATPNNPQTYTPVNHEVIRPSKSNSKEFYMSTPNKDGSFWDRNSRQELDPTASCYKFTETAPGTAEFVTVDSSTFFQLAFKNPDYIIDPVCDSRDALTSDRKRIITVTPGKAQKNGDKWNVTTKAKIRYE